MRILGMDIRQWRYGIRVGKEKGKGKKLGHFKDNNMERTSKRVGNRLGQRKDDNRELSKT